MKVYLGIGHEKTEIVNSENELPWGWIKQAETKHIKWYSRGRQIYALGKNGIELEHEGETTFQNS